jgi:hypothetical protein
MTKKYIITIKEEIYMLKNIVSWINAGTEAGVALIALGIVLQVIFGGTVPFIGGDIVGTITGIIAGLGNAGLVGLASLAVIYHIFTKK